ncbi:hypothetical protein FJY84_02945 [Candidatus Bathyarchaeota archaeon]|nr:hypothetical protein [Candidatus Bathyarchaeota archaeon]
MIGSEFLFSLSLWFIRALISSIICLILGYLGIRALSFITTEINEFESIKGDPMATSLFLGGFFIYAGLVIYGSMVNPFFLSQSVLLGPYFNTQRLLIVVLSVLVSFIFGSIFYYIFSKLRVFNVDLDDINKSPVSIGIFLFCYEIFLGLIVYASLSIPLG